MTRRRYVVRPCDNLGSVDGLVRDRTWIVYDTKTETSECERDTRAAARAEADRLNADPLYNNGFRSLESMGQRRRSF